MELIRAFRLDQLSKPARVAFVGAGGKTTAMFQCARELAEPVFVTATTHLALSQLDLADRHYFVSDVLLDKFEKDNPPGVSLLTNSIEQGSNRTSGVTKRWMERIGYISDLHKIPLLVEADGSRQRALKAPTVGEPPIPAFMNLVVVVSSLRAVGKPLNTDWVHRPEIFGYLSDLEMGEPITLKSIAQVMTHPEGGMKNIPEKARRIALLNQADTAELQAGAAEIKTTFLSAFNSVVVSSLITNVRITGPDKMTSNAQSSTYAIFEPVAGIILAAGGSHRFGKPKQLLEWQGKALVWHAAYKALRAGLRPVVVVCGAEIESIQRALGDLDVKIVKNPDWHQGQGTSVKVGVQSVDSQTGGILFLLADQPQIPIGLISKLVDSHTRSLSPITGPMVDEQRANPVLFDRITFDDLSKLSGDAGGRQLFGKYNVDWIPWHDSRPLIDIDTPGDYQHFLEMDL